jgi:signal transduction histidine kinase
MVLSNLVDNAIKFTEHGAVTVEVRSSDGGVEFAVQDTGIGIPPEARALIFEPFQQVGGRSRAGGVGLGLYIVRRLLDMMGGRVGVESAVGGGSTFRVWLPSVQADTLDQKVAQ